MNPGFSPPPRFIETMIERVIPGRVARDGVVGDLRAAFSERVAARGRIRALAWYVGEAVGIWTRYALFRLRRERELQRRLSRRRSRMANLAQDLRHAARRLVASPTMLVLSVLALTLGIGMPTIMFSVVNGVFRDLPVEDPEEVLRLVRTVLERGGERWDISHHDFADWRDAVTTFDGIAGFETEDVTLSGGDARPQRLNAAFVTPNVFDVLGVVPIVGRGFVAADAAPGAPATVVLSYRLWESRYGMDPDVQGSVLNVDGESRTVIGVMPERFGFPENEDVWLPVPLALDVDRADSPTMGVIGRLRDDATLPMAAAELQTIAARLATAYPETNAEAGASVRPFGDGLIDDEFARGLYTMLAAVSFVLLIACVNVANLMLAQAIDRTREIAVRTALGASRARVVRQFLWESGLVALAGGALGLAVAWFGLGLFNRTLTSLVGIAWVDIRVDGMVVLFVGGFVLAAAILSGLLPALQASRVNVNAALKEAPRAVAGSGLRMGSLRKTLVVAEVALSCALLCVSGLLIKGVLKLNAIDLGMPVAEIVTGEVELPRQVYTTPQQRQQFFQQLAANTAALPGVTSTAVMSDIPGTIGFQIPVAVNGPDGEQPTAPVGILTVSPGFLDVLGASVVQGRTFTALDELESNPVTIVNRRFAEAYFPDGDAVGRTVQVGSTARTVVGVVPDLFMGSLEEPEANGPGLYIPLGQSGTVSMQLMVRAAGDPLAVTAGIRDALEAMDPNIALMDVDRVDRLIARETIVFDVFGKLFLVFGLVALFLASIGVYGIMAFNVRQRTREWGVRMALGATGHEVLAAASRPALRQLALGLGIGVIVAGAMSRPLASFFYQVTPWDPGVFAVIVVLLAVVGMTATLLPARRATRVDPLDALHYE